MPKISDDDASNPFACCQSWEESVRGTLLVRSWPLTAIRFQVHPCEVYVKLYGMRKSLFLLVTILGTLSTLNVAKLIVIAMQAGAMQNGNERIFSFEWNIFPSQWGTTHFPCRDVSQNAVLQTIINQVVNRRWCSARISSAGICRSWEQYCAYWRPPDITLELKA